MRVVDRFADAQASCAFLRLSSPQAQRVSVALAGAYRVEDAPAGGWLLLPAGEVPPPTGSPWHRGHGAWTPTATFWKSAPLRCAAWTRRRASCRRCSRCPRRSAWTSWSGNSSPRPPELVTEFRHLLDAWRRSRCSCGARTRHTAVLPICMLHLVHRACLREPRRSGRATGEVCSELDAYSLYVTLSGLALATGKRLYSLLKQQVVYSVIARQAEDGGWYHGEWTDGMESHYRLVNAAVLMLAAHLEEHEDSVARKSLEKGAAFLATRAHKLDVGAWFMHDSLEGNAEGMRKYPFAWSTSTALGKATTNMLILNTHLDTTIALDRYAEATGDEQYQALVASARESAKAVLKLRPAEWLYRAIFRILDLTLLPRRAGAKDSLCTRGWSSASAGNIWPPRCIGSRRLSRAWSCPMASSIGLCVRRAFPHATRACTSGTWCVTCGAFRMSILHHCLTVRWNIRTTVASVRIGRKVPNARTRWDFGWRRFTTSACVDRDPKFRRWLAEAVIEVEQVGLGLPPSVLGANSEAIRPEEQSPCPSPADRGLRVVNLSRGANAEYLVVNATNHPLPLEWQVAPEREIAWTNQDGQALFGEH